MFWYFLQGRMTKLQILLNLCIPWNLNSQNIFCIFLKNCSVYYVIYPCIFFLFMSLQSSIKKTSLPFLLLRLFLHMAKINKIANCFDFLTVCLQNNVTFWLTSPIPVFNFFLNSSLQPPESILIHSFSKFNQLAMAKILSSPLTKYPVALRSTSQYGSEMCC